ncbi:MAG: carbohydrate ABC transporter permease [Candidatus Cloacimonetes bacterium]|nr:carbohydrate ABC transporter permease [Candidatus Cloacimonadota bacterium]
MQEKLIFGIKNSVIYIFLIGFGIIMVAPFAWMLSTSLKSQLEVNRGHTGFIPLEQYLSYDDGENVWRVSEVMVRGDSTVVNLIDETGRIARSFYTVRTEDLVQIKRVKLYFRNFTRIFERVPFGRYFLNTIFVSFTTLIGVIITSCLSAYAFARMRFKGRDVLFYFFISMMMVPEPIYLVPCYVLLNYLGWINTYQALIIPWIANIFTIFLMRQHFMSIPQDLLEAASIDGCSQFKILIKIILPLSKPVIATACVFSLIGSWNSFMWPLIMTNDPELRIIQVGLSYFAQESSSQTTLLMAASTLTILPLVMIFLIAQKNIMASYTSSGMKE